MTINFAQLKELMSPLEGLCKLEKTVELGGVRVTLKSLTPLEETEVQKLLPDVSGSPAAALEFADVFRKETLARAIVAINGVDLRDQEHVETSETLANGKHIKMSRIEAVSQLIDDWSRPVISKLYEHYIVLTEEIEKNMDESLKLNVESTEAEIENLEGRVEALKRPSGLDELSKATNADEQSVQ
jgi:hypothetical protein